MCWKEPFMIKAVQCGLAVLSAATLGVLAGCGSSPQGGAPATTTTAQTGAPGAARPSSSGGATVGNPAPSSLGDTAQCAAGTSTATLTKITTGRHDTFDRVVLEFSGPAPSCSADYVNQITQDPSSRPVALAGNAFLKVALHGAVAHDGGGRPTYAGANVIDTPALDNVKAVALAGDFEGYVTIGVGLNHKAHYAVSTLSDPTRVVIDVSH